MHKLLLFFLILSLTFSYHNIYGQRVNKFSEEPGLFAEELRNFMGSNLTENHTARVEEFIELWNSSLFNSNEMQEIITSFNALTALNARPVPHIINYAELLICILDNDKERQHYNVWKRSFNDILEKRDLSLSGINDFIIFTSRLIARNILYKSGALTWQASTQNFFFIYEDSLRIVFNDLDLYAFNHIDTLTIFRTGGVMCPFSMSWKGTEGTVTWERAGLEAGEAYAILGDYTIDLRGSEYIADSALFNFSRYFQSPLRGRLTDRVMSTSKTSEANYPRFTSDNQEYSIRDIYRSIDYEGGLSMQGAKLIGSGSDRQNARIIFYFEGQRWLTAESSHFLFSLEGISSISTSISFNLGDNSVFHPDLHLNYLDNTRELSLNQNQKVISKSPWANNFHQVDMSFARLLWKIDESEIRLTMPRASSIGNANFESLNLFNSHLYRSIQGIDNTNPLLSLRRFSDEYDADELPAEAYAKFLRRPLPGVRRQLLELTLHGFIFFDTDTDVIRIRQRLYDYLQANIRGIDYDIINFVSTTEAPLDNAILDLKTFDLKINGIPRVYISNSQNVNIFPEKEQVTLKENRNFFFNGTINAGNLSFFGNNFAFDYTDFRINLQDIDSISLRARLDETDLQGRARLTNVKNIIQNVTGELSVDKPDNKSSRVDYPEYPKFNSRENSYVFYDSPDIHNGVYRSEDFYFELYPFLIDSLNTFRNEDLRFSGKLFSAGIFPDFEETLILQEDYSLGIKHPVKETGIPVYDERGKYFHEITMSNKGLRGGGKLEYLTSEIYSEDFLFFPDSMNTISSEFIINKQKGGNEFPAVKSKNNVIQWLPYSDLITVSQTDNNFSVFNDRAGLDGSLNITPEGLTGSGDINLDQAVISSKKYVFGAESFNSDLSNFILHDPEKPDQSLIASGVSSFIDLEGREGKFSVVDKDEMISLPLNRYMANPETFIWDMDNQDFEFRSEKSDPETGLSGAKYISVMPGQDSLFFFSPYAILEYRTNLLTAREVKNIQVADALVYPSDETVIIGEKGKMHPLQDAVIQADNKQSFHEIYNATVQIDGKNDFRGSGNYDYLDEKNDVQTIHLDKISVNEDIETVASGEIHETDKFMLNPQFSFTGVTKLLSSRAHLEFNGATKISHRCEGLSANWLAFENVIDPLDVLIQVPVQPVSPGQERIYSGIFIATDSVHVYPAFFSERKNYADKLIVEANGYIKYDQHSGEYVIAAKDKLRDQSLPGNLLRLNPDKCILSGEGPLELGVTLGQLELNAVGSAYNRINVNETILHGTVTLDFFFSEDAISILAQEADSLKGQPMDSSAYYFTKGLNELLGQKRAGEYLSRSAREIRQARLPGELQKTFVLSDVNLKWNKESRSYRSRGKIGVAYINGVKINRMFTGYLEITKRRSGDYLDFYIELGDNWYYFGYTRGVMQSYSSNPEFVNIIDDLALRHRRKRVSSSETRYVFMLATDTKTEQFFNVYRRHLREYEAENPGGGTLDQDEKETEEMNRP